MIRFSSWCFLLTSTFILCYFCVSSSTYAQTPAPSNSLENLGWLQNEYGFPVTNYWKEGELLYAAGRQPVSQTGSFVVYSTRTRKIIKTFPRAYHDQTGIMVDREGNAYFTDYDSTQKYVMQKYDPRTNTITNLNVGFASGGHIRASVRQSSNGWIYGFTERPNKIVRFHPDLNGQPVAEEVADAWSYAITWAMDPTEKFLYYAPDPHGGWWKKDAPVLQFNVETKQHKVIAFLNQFYESKYGYLLGGPYSINLDPEGKRLFIATNACDLDRDNPLDYCAPTKSQRNGLGLVTFRASLG